MMTLFSRIKGRKGRVTGTAQHAADVISPRQNEPGVLARWRKIACGAGDVVLTAVISAALTCLVLLVGGLLFALAETGSAADWQATVFNGIVAVTAVGAFIRLLRKSYERINPAGLAGYGHLRDERQWGRYLQAQYHRHWKVHFAKKTRGAWRNVKYIGRYLKRPPVAASQLRHYSGGAVVHQYYDHRTQQHRQQTMSQEEMIGRYISHIPARHFKMVRYYGFLSNRKRGSLLPKVYEALEMEVRKKPEAPGFAVLMKGFLGTDPYKCILCGDRLRFAGAQAGQHATEMLSERLDGIEKKRWLRAQHAG